MTAALEIEPLPFPEPGWPMLNLLGGEPWSMWLDSGQHGTGAGRYDILVGRPRVTLVTRGGVTEIRRGGNCLRRADDPLALLQEELNAVEPPAPAELPFTGGAVGYFAYDLGQRLMGVAGAPAEVPEMAVGIYDHAVVVDHLRAQCWAVGRRLDRQWLQALRARTATAPRPGLWEASGPLVCHPDDAAYATAFRRVQDYLHAGDCYQVNLARRFTLPGGGDPQAAYLALRGSGSAPFAAWLRLPGSDVLSLSPERFLRVDADGWVTTEPIKGTRPRKTDRLADERARQELLASAKDRAENVMIVDLLRNDLGRVCRFGSVHVPALCEARRFARVHHLVSTVRGQLAPGYTATDLLRGSLPGGSITGAPKRRAMEIIAELEPGSRGVYCGAVGYIGFDGRMDTSIAIRTAVCQGGAMTYWAGGGIVADSSEAAERRETEDKAIAFLELAGAAPLREASREAAISRVR